MLRTFVIIAALVLAVNASSVAVPAHAGTIGENINLQRNAANQGAGGGGTVTDVSVIVTRIINAALGLIGAIFVSLMVYAGFRWMTAGGDKDAVETAQKTIRNSIIGLVVVLLAYSISNFVIQRLIFATS